MNNSDVAIIGVAVGSVIGGAVAYLYLRDNCRKESDMRVRRVVNWYEARLEAGNQRNRGLEMHIQSLQAENRRLHGARSGVPARGIGSRAGRAARPTRNRPSSTGSRLRVRRRPKARR